MGKLRAARKDAGLRLVDVAHLVGRGRDWLHRVETSQVRLDVLQFVQLCNALNLSSPALLEELEESSDDDSFLAIRWAERWLGIWVELRQQFTSALLVYCLLLALGDFSQIIMH